MHACTRIPKQMKIYMNRPNRMNNDTLCMIVVNRQVQLSIMKEITVRHLYAPQGVEMAME